MGKHEFTELIIVASENVIAEGTILLFKTEHVCEHKHIVSGHILSFIVAIGLLWHSGNDCPFLLLLVLGCIHNPPKIEPLLLAEMHKVLSHPELIGAPPHTLTSFIANEIKVSVAAVVTSPSLTAGANPLEYLKRPMVAFAESQDLLTSSRMLIHVP